MDRFARYRSTGSNPPRACAPILPSPSTDLALIPQAIFVGSGGDIRLRCVEDIEPVGHLEEPAVFGLITA